MIRNCCAAAVVFLLPFSVLAQNATGVYRTADGGSREVLESIFVPPIKNAPFSLTLDTEWSRPLNGGGSYTVVNRRHIMRDSDGRIYQERWFLVPKGGKIQSTMNWIQISDPDQHFYYNCSVETKVCTKKPYGDSTTKVYKPMMATSGPLPDRSGTQKHEDLGSSSVGGVPTTGYRDTTTINPGVFGNDQPMMTTREYWYSARLGFNLISILDAPQVGKQVFTVSEISTIEPEGKFFLVPEGYTVPDEQDDSPRL
jgi:hypothetical protein